MASTIKLKFAGFVRGLLRQLDDSAPARPVASPTPASAAPSSAPATPAMAARPEMPAREMASGNGALMLPLAPIIAGLPMDLKAKLMNEPSVGQTISLSVESVVQQLAFGTVKLSFGELRQLAPGIFANNVGDSDTRIVSLPLQQILSRINPALLSRRSAQKVEVSEEVAGPFDGRGRGVNFTSQPLKPPTPAAPPLTGLSHAAPLESRLASPPVSRPAPPTAEAFTFKPRQTAPPAPPVTFNPPVSNGNGHSNGNGNGQTNGHTNGHGQPGLPPFKFSAAPVSPAPAASSAPRPELAQPMLPPAAPVTLLVSLDDLAENWPDALKQEILQTLGNASAALPLALIEPGLKRGRVTMTWKELRMLSRPSSAPSVHDVLTLDLPLKVLAPAFLAAQKKLGRHQQKVQVSAEIPNLFFGFPQSAPAPAAEVAPTMLAPAPLSTAPVPPVISVAPARNQVADTNFFTSHDTVNLRMASAPATDFLNRQMHPKEVVTQAMTLPGVAGAVVSLVDGLRVASEVPAELNPDTVAAFLPQIYDRVNQSTRELRMGALNNVSFTVGNIPWKIFRVNSIYFAAFGRAGEKLPKAQLAALAAELDRKK